MPRGIGLASMVALACVLGAPAESVRSAAAGDDTEVTIEIGTKEVQLNKQDIGKVELTCPATEASPPCSGQVKLKTRDKFQFGGRNNLVLLAAQRYDGLGAGESMTVKLTVGEAQLELLEENPSARKIRIQVTVKDTAGNRVQVNKLGKIVLP